MDKIDILLKASSRRKAGTFGTRFFNFVETLERSAAISYILDSNYRFIYTNPAWDSFAQANGAPQLADEGVIGSNNFECIPDALKPFYVRAFEEAAETDHVWGQTYECSSPERARQFRMSIYFLRNRDWFLVTNSLLVENPQPKIQRTGHYGYLSQGIITMCAHCRCAKRADGSNQWDFVPKYVRLKGPKAVNVSHALCPVCQAHFYPNLD